MIAFLLTQIAKIKAAISAINTSISGWEAVDMTAVEGVEIYSTSKAYKHTAFKLASIGLYLPLSSAFSPGDIVISGLPVPDGNVNVNAVNFKEDTSKVPAAVYITSSGELKVRADFASGDTLMVQIVYKTV